MIEKIKNLIRPYLDSLNIKLINVKIKSDYGIKNIIEVTLKGKDLNSNIENIHYKILDLIDSVMPEGYYLEVGSIGAEYYLENESDIIQHINNYIYIVSDKYKGYGYLRDYSKESKILKIEVKEKTRSKILDILNDNIKIRTAVKV